MKISETSPTRLVTTQEPVRKRQVSSPMPLAAVPPAPAKPLTTPDVPTFVSTQPATEPVTYTVHSRRVATAVNDNPNPPRPVLAQNDPRRAYESVASFSQPS